MNGIHSVHVCSEGQQTPLWCKRRAMCVRPVGPWVSLPGVSGTQGTDGVAAEDMSPGWGPALKGAFYNAYKL